MHSFRRVMSECEQDLLPLVPPPEAERAGATSLTADMLAAHVERVGIIDIEEALLLGVPGVALRPSMCTDGEAEHASESLPVGDRLRAEKQMRKMQEHAAKAAEVRVLVARVLAVKADGNECFIRGDLSSAVERYEAALALLQRPRETEGGSDEDDLPSVPPREAESVVTLRVEGLVPEEFIQGLASLLRAGGEPADVDMAKELAVTCCINLAQCAARLERPADAVSACNVALELDERRGKAWFRRGQARSLQKPRLPSPWLALPCLASPPPAYQNRSRPGADRARAVPGGDEGPDAGCGALARLSGSAKGA